MLPADSPFASLSAPGPHPATAELRAYAAGTLALAGQHRIETHTLDCARCADLLAGFSLTDTVTTDQAVATLRARLQVRLGEAPPAPAAPRGAIAAPLLGVAAGGVWIWEHRATTTPAATARLETAQSASPATTESRPALATTTLAPARIAAVAPAPATAEVADEPRMPAYAVARPARPQHPARLRHAQSIPIAVVRPAAPSQSATARQAVSTDAPEANAAPKTRLRQLAATPVPTGASVATAAPANTSSERASAKKAGVDSVTSAQGAVVAGQRSKPKPPAAENTTTVRVANTPMPAALAINPVPVGDSAALPDYLRRAANDFKTETNSSPLVGTVRVKFTVEADGKLSNLKVVRGLRADYNSEALRIVCDGPTWQPGVAGGRRAPLPMEVTVPL